MITRFQTSRSDRIQVAIGIVSMVFLWIFFPVIISLLPGSEISWRSSEVGWAFLGTSLSGIPALGILLWKAVFSPASQEAYLLSPRTLAILRPKHPVRFIKSSDIEAIKPNPLRILLEDGESLVFSGMKIGVPGGNPARETIKLWYGKEALVDARVAWRKRLYPAWSINSVIALTVGTLVAALFLAFSGNWPMFAKYCSMAFYATAAVGCVYLFAIDYLGRRFKFPLSPHPIYSPGASEACVIPIAPDSGVGVNILRFPKLGRRTFEYVAAPALTILGLFIFIPLCKSVFSHGPVGPEAHIIVLVVAVDLVLVAAYCLWRIYKSVVCGDVFVTVLLSPRSMAVLRPRRPVVFVKPEQCEALVLGSNELELRDGRTLYLGVDQERLEERGVCAAICKRWWPEVLIDMGEETPGVSKSVEKQIVMGVVFFVLSLGAFGIQAFVQNTLLTVVALHLFIGGIVFVSLAVQRWSRGYGHRVPLRRAPSDVSASYK